MGSRTKIDYVYILGASHSGSTLLAMLLNAHPDVTTIGETAPGRMGDINTYRCSCGELIKECSFWKSITEEMREKHPDFYLDNFATKFEFPSSPLVNRLLNFEHRGVLLEYVRDAVLWTSPGWNRAQNAIMARCYDFVVAVLAESGGYVFVDSCKLAHRLKFLLRVQEFNIKVIHLVRDGRAVALTYMRQDEFADAKEPSSRRGGSGVEGAATALSLPMQKAADEWRRCLRSAEHVLAGLDESQWIQVHYEQLCSDTDTTLTRLFEFLDLDPQKPLNDFRSVEHHVVGNGMRLDTTSQISLDERWRSALTEDELRIFDRVAGKMNRKYGYE